MKRILLAALFAGALLTSCIKDDTLYYNVTEMGVLRDGKIVSDTGITYTITEMTETYDLTGLDRILFLGDVLASTGDRTYNLRLKSIFSVPTPGIVPAADFVAPTEPSGDRPALIQTAWLGGGYLNLSLGYFVGDGSKVEHRFTLAEQTVPEGKDTLFLRLYHNAGTEDEYWDGSSTLEDEGMALISAYYSFPITPFVPTTDKPRPLKVLYSWHAFEDDMIVPDTVIYSLKGELEK